MKLKDILKSDQVYSQDLLKYDNENTMNSVAMIIRKILNPSSIAKSFNYQLLLLQRSFDHNSAHSGQICFPGGRREAGQTSWQTVVREIKQQTELILEQQNLIVKVPSPFFSYQSRNKLHTITLYIFELIPKNGKYDEIQINPSQISDYKWINLDFFIDVNQKVMNKLIYTKYKNFPFEHTIPLQQLQVKLINKNLLAILYPSLKIGLKSELFGFTYYALICIMNKVYRYLDARNLVKQQLKTKIEDSMNFSHDFGVQLKQECPNKKAYEKIAEKTFQQSMSLYTGFWPKSKL